MRIAFDEEAWEDFTDWQRVDPKIAKRICDLIRDILRHPFEGIGKPEPLRNEWSGWWSRRIDREHRLVYRVETDCLLVAQCRYHY